MKKIKKVSQAIAVVGKVLNSKSTSTQDTYSCDYINNNVGIVESGSNENGSYIKFADGTLIQYGSRNCTANINSTNGFNHYYSQNTLNFPINFSNTEYKIFTNINSENVTIINLVYGSVKTTSTFGLNFISSNENDTRTIQWFAKGRWK